MWGLGSKEIVDAGGFRVWCLGSKEIVDAVGVGKLYGRVGATV